MFYLIRFTQKCRFLELYTCRIPQITKVKDSPSVSFPFSRKSFSRTLSDCPSAYKSNAYRIPDFQGFSKTPSARRVLFFYYIKLNTKIPRAPHIDPGARRGRRVFESDVVWRRSRSPSANCSREVYSGSPGSPGSAARHAILRRTELDALIAALVFRGGGWEGEGGRRRRGKRGGGGRTPASPVIAAVFLSGQQVDELP